MHLTQPAISHQIKALENSAGITLFERTNKNLNLTEAGRHLLSRAEQILEIAESATVELEGSSQNMRGVLRVGAPMEIGVHWLLPYTTDFFSKHRDLTLEATLSHPQEIRTMLIDHSLDCAITIDPVVSEGIRCDVVTEEELILVGSPDVAKRVRDWKTETLSEFGFLSYEHGDEVLKSWLKHHGLLRRNDVIKPRAYINSFQAMKTWLVTGMGVAVVPRHSIEEEIKAKSLVIITPEKNSPPLTKPIYFAIRETLLEIQRFKEFRKFLIR